jgi:CDGSH-type Zn-finger protein
MNEFRAPLRVRAMVREVSTVDDKMSIGVTKDGPYVVSGAVPVVRQTIVTDEKGESVAWQDGEHLPAKPSCTLCRCGVSDNKPYCDGSHVLAGFDGTETASHATYEEAAVAIPGPRIVLMDQVDLCADARFCAAKGKEWRRVELDDDESCRIVIDESNLCPSGRYTAVELDGTVHEPELAPEIGLVEDPQAGVSGPLWIQGGIPVTAADGTPYPVRNRVTLCRCGKSSNKPFCDGAHIEAGFDDGAIRGSETTWW